METQQKKVQLSPNSLRVLEKRYLSKDSTGKVIETPDELFRRVAKNISQAELNYSDGEEMRVEAEQA
ncbi:MAG: ribonucleotide reductase N-terminal alpha domain-containing protein, partial [Nitrospiria bacterium]